jgi:hypothetical protein
MTKKRNPNDAVVGNVKRLREELRIHKRASAAAHKALAARVRWLEITIANLQLAARAGRGER